MINKFKNIVYCNHQHYVMWIKTLCTVLKNIHTRSICCCHSLTADACVDMWLVISETGDTSFEKVEVVLESQVLSRESWVVSHGSWVMSQSYLVTCDSWLMTHDSWPMTHDVWFLTRDPWLMSYVPMSPTPKLLLASEIMSHMSAQPSHGSGRETRERERERERDAYGERRRKSKTKTICKSTVEKLEADSPSSSLPHT